MSFFSNYFTNVSVCADKPGVNNFECKTFKSFKEAEAFMDTYFGTDDCVQHYNPHIFIINSCKFMPTFVQNMYVSHSIYRLMYTYNRNINVSFVDDFTKQTNLI
jgi:hypothetical protein